VKLFSRFKHPYNVKTKVALLASFEAALFLFMANGLSQHSQGQRPWT